MSNLTPNQEKFCQEYEKCKDFSYSKLASGLEHPMIYGSHYYVYLLINPFNGEIFYVGKGKGKRAEGHLKENLRGTLSNGKKHKIINEIVESGEKPDIVVFSNNLEENDALTLERKLIQRLRKFITNTSSGSFNKHEANQQRAIAILRKALPFETWVRQRERSDFQIELYLSLVDKLNQVAQGKKKMYDTISITHRSGFNCVEVH